MSYILAKAQYSVLNDLKQEKIFITNILKQILNSRRLLIDHVECLESILFELEEGSSKNNIVTFKTTCVLASLVILINSTDKIWKSARYGATLVGSTFGMMCVYKNMKNMRNIRKHRRVDALIQCLQSFGNCIKKTIAYYNESQFMKGEKLINEDVHYKRAWGCIQNIKTVTETLFYETRHLEEIYKISSYLVDIYAPIEDLNTCQYFTKPMIEFSSQHIKDFYNIFAYMQSQFLLRLALSVIENANIDYFNNGLTKVTCQIREVLQKEENSITKTTVTIKQRLEERSRLRASSSAKNMHGPLSILKGISLSLTSTIIAVAEECESVDNVLQNIRDESDDLSKSENLEELTDIGDTLEAIDHRLSSCHDDFQRLMLIYKKCILKQSSSSLKIHESKESLDTDQKADQLTEELTNGKHAIDIPSGDDYFAYLNDGLMNDEDDSKGLEKYLDYELYNLDHKITKKRFKPVLKQLVDKIDPIRENTLQIERKILESKGIDLSKFDSRESEAKLHFDDDGSESDDAEVSEKRKRPTRSDKYEDVREFLVSKAPTNLFMLSRPLRGMCEEDIIE